MCCFDRPVRVGRLPTIEESLGPANVECPRCEGVGWVCENHPDVPWPGMVSDEAERRHAELTGGCYAPGMPCACRPGAAAVRSPS